MNSAKNINNGDDKLKPFRLVKYFTYSGLIVIFLITILISFLNTHWAKTLHLKKSEEYAQLLIENLNHQVFIRFLIPAAMKFGKIQLRNKEQFQLMDQVVKSTLHGFLVDNVNIYDMKNTVSYSYDNNLIGKSGLGKEEYQKAITGTLTSRLIQNGSFIEIMIGNPEQVKLVTFAPLRAERPLSGLSGPVLGVVEITQDITEDNKTIFNFQIVIILTSTTLMGLLFLLLVFVVKRGEGISQSRTLERIRLKDELSKAQHLSSIGEMTATISHEIRNPLGIIRSSAGLLQKKMVILDPGNTIPAIITEETERLNNIITDFLSYARPRDPYMIPCQIEKIILKTIHFLKPQLDQVNCVAETEFSKKTTKFFSDPDMLYQAFLNIIINAIQAMPDGGTIYIRSDVDSLENNIVLYFRDEGVGIPDKILTKIWDPFFTAKDRGTGLGLGIVKKIIESLNGAIDIVNRKEAGAKVTITLPLQTKG